MQRSDEHVTVEFEHRGTGDWCALQVLDDCREVVAEVRLDASDRQLYAYLPALWQHVPSGLGVDEGWWRTRFVFVPGRVSLFSWPSGATADGPAWTQAELPDLQVVAGVAIQLVGPGDFWLRRARVVAQSPREV